MACHFKNALFMVKKVQYSNSWPSHMSLPFEFRTASAARKVDTKVANLLPKVAQKVATLKNRFKTSLKQVFKIYIFRP